MIKIYTDGSCLTNPGDGGWAAIITINGEIKEISGSEKNTTNNRMELLAPIRALKEMKQSDQIEIYTDSQYVKLGITEWINTWVVNNWKTSKKEDVKNKDLWVELYDLNKSLNVKWNWVKAHAGNVMNAWGKENNVGDKILMMGDPFLNFTKAIGADVDKSGRGLGVRSNRYTMLVDDMKVIKLQEEKDTGSCEISAAENFLELV